MGLFTRLVGKSVNTYWKKYRKWYFIGFGTLLVLGVFNYFINNYTDQIVGTIIKNAVAKETDGLYTVDFDDIALIVNDGSIYLKNFSLNIDSTALAADTARFNNLKYVYSTRVPDFYLKVSNLLALYFKRELHVSGVKVNRPNFRVLALQGASANRKFTLEVGNAYNLISGYLKVFAVKDFEMDNGEFFFDKYHGGASDNFHVKDISMKIKNLLIDENTEEVKDKFFFSDQVEINIKNQEMLLKDNLHKVTFDNLFISTASSEVVVDNFRVYRLKGQRMADEQNLFDIHVPQFKLTGVDFFKAYNDNVLNIASMEFSKPDLNLSFYANENKRETVENSFINLAMLYFDQWNVKQFTLDDAKLTLKTNERNSNTQNSFGNIYARISDFSIDTVNQTSDKRKYNYKDIDLAVRNYEFELADSIHVLKAGEVGINSKPSRIYLKDLTIQPRQDVDVLAQLKKNHQFETYSLQLKYGVVSDVDFTKILNTDTISLSEVNLDSPQFVYHRYPVLAKYAGPGAAPFDLFNPYPLVKRLTDAVYLHKLIIHQGGVQWLEKNTADTVAHAKNLNITLSNVSLDSLTKLRTNLMGAEQSDLTVSNIHFKDQHLETQLSNATFRAGKTSDLFAATFAFRNIADSLRQPQTPRFNVSGRRFRASGIDFHHIMHEHQVVGDSVRLANALIDIDLPRPKGNTQGTVNSPGLDFIKNLDIHYFQLLNSSFRFSIGGKTRMRADSLGLALDGLYYDTLSNGAMPFQFARLWMACHDLWYFPNDGIHFVGVEDIAADTRDSLLELKGFRMRQILVNPLQQDGNNFTIYLPDVKAVGFDLSKMLGESVWQSREVTVTKPFVNINFLGGNDAKRDKASISLDSLGQLIGPLKALRAQNIKIIQGNAKIAIQSPDGDTDIESKNLDVDVDGLELNRDSPTERRLFYANNYKITSDYFSLLRRREGDYTSVNDFILDTRKKTLSASGLYYSKNVDEAHRNQYKFNLGQLHLDGLDYYALVNEHQVNVERAFVRDANLDAVLHIDAEPTGRAWQFLNKYPLDSTMFTTVDVGEFNFEKGRARFDIMKNGDSNILDLPEVNVMAKKVHLDPKLAVKQQRLGFSDDVQFDFINPNYKFNQGLQVLNIDHLMINLPDSLVVAQGFSLVPQKGKYEYAPAVGHQIDWMKIGDKEIRLEKVDFNKLVLHRIFEAQKLVMDQLDVSVFRDKRLPLLQGVYVKLPQEQLRELPFPVRLDSALLRNATVTYQEQVEESSSPGEVYFTRLNAKAGNIVNEPEAIAQNPHCVLKANSYVMDKGFVQASFDFDLADKNGKHEYNVTVGPFDLDEFNRILSPNAFVRIRNGVNRKLAFHVTADNDYAKGEMKFFYNNLRIALLNKNSETPKGLGNAIGSFFANTFVINNNNPHLIFVKKGNMFFERDKSKSIFNYWTKTFFSGIVSSIGAKNNKKDMRRYKDQNPTDKEQVNPDSTVSSNDKQR